MSLRGKERLIQIWLKDATDLKQRAQISNRMRLFLKLDTDTATVYFKDHAASIKDKSTMRNALGFKFEKKKKEAESGAEYPKKDHKGAGKANFNHAKDLQRFNKVDMNI